MNNKPPHNQTLALTAEELHALKADQFSATSKPAAVAQLRAAIFNATYEFIGLLRPDGTLLDANPAALEFVGATLDDLKGRPFADTPWWRKDEAGRAQLQAGIAAAARGEFVRFEAEHHGADDTAITVDFSLKPVRDEHGAVVLLVPEGRDITERKQAEAALHRTYDELESKVRERTAALETEIAARKQSEADALFLSHLSGRIRRDGEPEGLTHDVAQAVGKYLRVQRCFFTEQDLTQECFTIHQDYCDGVPSMAGTFPNSTFNARWLELAGTGQTLVLCDAANDERTASYDSYRQFGIGAFVSVPLLRNGKLVASLTVNSTVARDWQLREIVLLEAVAERTWQVLERLRAESNIQLKEARFASIINSAMDAIISVDSQQHIVLFNHAAELMFGYSADEMTGQPLERLLPASARAKHAEHIQRFGTTNTTTRTMGALGAISGVRKGGEEFSIEASISQVEANGQKLYTVILRDITRRKEAEERVTEQAALLNLAREAIVVIGADGNTLFWNTGAERLYGWPAEEAIGRDLNTQMYGADQTQREAARRALLEKGEWTGELRQFTKDGKEIIIESHWTQLRDSAGQHKAKLIISTDITEKKQLEAQFLRAQRMESIGTLAGGIAHDLNNILSPISMGLQMMQMKYTDEHTQKMLGMMTTNVNRGADMVKQILQFARGVSGERLALQPKHIVKDLLKMMAETFPKSIAIKQQLAEDTELVLGDATQFHQVLLNLCVNARDAMPHGGTLTLSLANEEIQPSYSPSALAVAPDAKPGKYVVLTVADTGEGIAPEVLDRIFDPFFTTKEVGKGTGLGLSTVFGIVRAHEGFITVASKVGQGTQFKVHLPAHFTQTAEATTTTRHDTPVGQGELVLVVDDEAAIRDMSRAALETYGYRVVTASDGAKAVALYAQHQTEVQLMLTDVMMPVMDGVTLIRTLRQLNPDLRVICCSGTAGAMDNPAIEQLGVQRILAKPLNAETLLRAVGQVLNEKR